MKIWMPSFFLLLLFPFALKAQGVINNGATIQIINNANIKIMGSGLVNQANASINNWGNIYIDNNFSQTGIATNYTGTGWIVFENGTNQTLYCDNLLTVAKLAVNNSNKLLLASNLTISDSLDLMNNGSIQLGSNHLLLSATAKLINYNKNNYIISDSSGYLQAQVAAASVFFPVGNSSYNPLTISNSGTADNFRVRVEDKVWTGGSSGANINTDIVNRTWHISEEVVGASIVDLTVQWNSLDETPGFDRNNAAVSHFDGAIWDHSMAYTPATSIALNTWAKSRLGQSSFSPFMVEDVTFSSDFQPNSQSTTSAATLVLLPNPTTDILKLRFDDVASGSARVAVYNLQGQLLFNQEIELIQGRIIPLPKTMTLAAGTYWLKVILEEEVLFAAFEKIRN